MACVWPTLERRQHAPPSVNSGLRAKGATAGDLSAAGRISAFTRPIRRSGLPLRVTKERRLGCLTLGTACGGAAYDATRAAGADVARTTVYVHGVRGRGAGHAPAHGAFARRAAIARPAAGVDGGTRQGTC